MLTGSIPPTGIPLPFVSAGGTSLSVFMGAIGILCNVSKMSEYSEYFQTKKSFSFDFKPTQKAKVKQ